MAAATFPERIQDDLAILIAGATVIDLSQQRTATATEDAAKTLRVCEMAAAKIEEPDLEDKINWIKTFEAQQSRLGLLSVKLRLAPNSRTRVDTLKIEDKPKATRDFA